MLRTLWICNSEQEIWLFLDMFAVPFTALVLFYMPNFNVMFLVYIYVINTSEKQKKLNCFKFVIVLLLLLVFLNYGQNYLI